MSIVEDIKRKLADDPLYSFLVENNIEEEKLFNEAIIGALNTRSYYSFADVASILNVEGHTVRNIVNRNDLKTYLDLLELGDSKRPKLDFIGAFKIWMHHLISTEFAATPKAIAALAGVTTVGLQNLTSKKTIKKNNPTVDKKELINLKEDMYLEIHKMQLLMLQSSINNYREMEFNLTQRVEELRQEERYYEETMQTEINQLKEKAVSVPKSQVILKFIKVTNPNDEIIKGLIASRESEFEQKKALLAESIKSNTKKLEDVRAKISNLLRQMELAEPKKTMKLEDGEDDGEVGATLEVADAIIERVVDENENVSGKK